MIKALTKLVQTILGGNAQSDTEAVMHPGVISRSSFSIDLPLDFFDDLASRLKARSWPAPVRMDGELAIVLDGGLGPAWYLTVSGRILAEWDDPLEVTRDRAHEAIVIGWHKTGDDALLTLLPMRPADAASCAQCRGDRFYRPWQESEYSHICDRCHGLGWTASSQLPGT